MSEQQHVMYARGAGEDAGASAGVRPDAGEVGYYDQYGYVSPEEVRAIRTALIEGEQSGPARPFDFDEFLQRMEAKYVTGNGKISP